MGVDVSSHLGPDLGPWRLVSPQLSFAYKDTRLIYKKMPNSAG